MKRRRRTKRHETKRRRGGVLPPGTYRKWAELFRPESLEKPEKEPKR